MAVLPGLLRGTPGIASLLADTIVRISNEESVSSLFTE